ncbi:MAG: hypothetical protein A2020_14565 [Lentisphaerae bacterium GWF2_45_14]|nr:MAG: hypothetical protein A2020_14565 [Lentisphaerae bacterium GWF2_45_14]
MRKSYRECGQTILESTLSMLLLCLILMGLLQLFHLYVAQMLTDFSAFYTARSRSVGFADYIVERAGKALVVAASGPRSYPEENTSDEGVSSSSTSADEMMLHEYLSGERWLEYQYWSGQNEYGSEWSSRAEVSNTYFTQESSSLNNGLVESTVFFTNYPFPIFDLMDPDRVWFEGTGENTLINATSEVADYSIFYLEE